MKFISVKFTSSYSPYTKGEIAGFPEKRATALINGGVAIPVNPEHPESAAGIRALRGAPETRHIPGPPNTRKVEGPAPRKCGKCGKPGHTKANCPEK